MCKNTWIYESWFYLRKKPPWTIYIKLFTPNIYKCVKIPHTCRCSKIFAGIQYSSYQNIRSDISIHCVNCTFICMQQGQYLRFLLLCMNLLVKDIRFRMCNFFLPQSYRKYMKISWVTHIIRENNFKKHNKSIIDKIK